MMLIRRSSHNKDNEYHIVDGIEYKRCTKCFELRVFDEFGKDKRGFIGLTGRCRVCDKTYRDANKERAVKYNQEYREENKESLKVQGKEYRENHKEEKSEYDKNYREENKEMIAARDKVYRENNAAELQAKKLIYRSNKYKNNPHFKLNRIVAQKIRHALKHTQNKKKYFYGLNYSIEELKNHLIKTLPEGYTWNDYLSGIIQIDHKKPLALFYYTSIDEPEFKECWDIDNLQLLLARDNLMKGVKYDDISEAS